MSHDSVRIVIKGKTMKQVIASLDNLLFSAAVTRFFGNTNRDLAKKVCAKSPWCFAQSLERQETARKRDPHRIFRLKTRTVFTMRTLNMNGRRFPQQTEDRNALIRVCVCAYVYCPTAQVENSSFHAEDINMLAAVLKVLMIILLAWGAGILGVVNYRQVQETGKHSIERFKLNVSC